MSKRAFEAVNAPDMSEGMIVDSPSVGARNPQALSPVALHMPGQWEPIYWPQTAAPSTSTGTLFTTARKFALNITVGNVKVFLDATFSFFARYARRQIFRPEIVHREDGACKKILLDAGVVAEPRTPQNHARASIARNAYSSRHQASLNSRRFTPNQFVTAHHFTPQSSGFNELWNTPPAPASPDTPALAGSWPDTQSPSSLLDCSFDSSLEDVWHSTPRAPYEPEADNAMIMTPETGSTHTESPIAAARRTQRLSSRSSPLSQRLATISRIQKRLQASPASLTRSPRSRPLTERSALSSQRASMTPHTLGSNQVTPIGAIESPCPSNGSQFSQPLTNQVFPPRPLPLHHRVRALSNGNATHTNRSSVLRSSEHRPADTEPHRMYVNSTAFKNAAAATASRAQKENEAYKLEFDARKKETEAEQLHKREMEEAMRILAVEEESKRKADENMFGELSFTGDEDDLNYVSTHDVDLSTLPDAPSPRRVRFATQGMSKTFYKDDAACDMLDSFLEDIVLSPERQQFTDVDEEVSEIMPSDEFRMELQNIEDRNVENWRMLESQGFPPLSELSGLLRSRRVPALQPLVSPLTALEKMRLDSAVRATNNGHTEVDLLPGRLNTHDFKTLLPQLFNGSSAAWLNDSIVDYYIGILVEHQKAMASYKHRKDGPAPPVHVFGSQWFTNIKRNPSSVKNWASKKQLGGAQLLDANLVLFPICLDSHWRLLAIKPKHREIEYLDSLGYKPETIKQKAFQWLQMELGELYKEEWTFVEKQRSVKQLNASDCGVFVCLNALALLRGEDASRVVSVKWMMDARQRIAVSLLAGKPTTEFE